MLYVLIKIVAIFAHRYLQYQEYNARCTVSKMGILETLDLAN